MEQNTDEINISELENDKKISKPANRSKTGTKKTKKTSAKKTKKKTVKKDDTKFEKGKSGNPTGRPKRPEWFKERISEITPLAVDALEDILKNEKAKTTDRISAAKLTLEYGIGKPTQMVDVSGDLKNTALTVIKFEGDLDEWSK